MPALTMRGRYVMREYWSDSDLFLRMTSGEREIYIGLWMLADDEGWMPRDIPAIAAALYRYEDRTAREANVRSTLDHLRVLGKITSHRCCLFLPAVARYPRSGRRSTEHVLAHQTHSKGFEGIQRYSTSQPVPTLPVPSLPSNEPNPASPTSGGGLGEKLAAAGLKPEIANGRS